MKKLLFVAMLCPGILMGQKVNLDEGGTPNGDPVTVSEDGTTMEEWLYATKGYKDDVSKGKDPSKKGYLFESKTEKSGYDGWGNKTKAELIEMRRESDRSLRVVIVLYDTGTSINSYAFPLPDSEPKIKKACQDQIAPGEGNKLKLILDVYHQYAISRCN